MKKHWENFKLNKRAYLICSIGQSYIDMVEPLVHQLEKYTSYPVFLYYAEGNVGFETSNLVAQKFELPDSCNHKVEGMKPEDVRFKMLTMMKPRAASLFINNYDVEEFVFLDADIIVTPVIDKAFDYCKEVDNYPLFIRYTWDWITINGRNLVCDAIIERIGAPNLPTVRSTCSCFYVANRNCKSFINDWDYYCQDKALISYCVDNPNKWGDINDESISNCLIWMYKGVKVLPCDLMWSLNSKAVDFVFDVYSGKIAPLEKVTCYGDSNNHLIIPEEHESPTGLSIIRDLKQDQLGFHGIKDLTEIKKSVDIIDNRFF